MSDPIPMCPGCKRLWDEVMQLKADRDRLRAVLEYIGRNTCCEGCQEAARVARKALEGQANE